MFARLFRPDSNSNPLFNSLLKQQTIPLNNTRDQEVNSALCKHDTRNWTGLHYLACNQDSKTIKAFLNKTNQATLDNTLSRQNNLGWTPLHYALRFQEKDTIDFLLRKSSPKAIYEATNSKVKISACIKRNRFLNPPDKQSLLQLLKDNAHFVTVVSTDVMGHIDDFIAYIETRLPCVSQIDNHQKWLDLLTPVLTNLEKSNNPNHTTARDKLYALIGRIYYGTHMTTLVTNMTYLTKAKEAYLKITSPKNISADDNFSASEVLSFFESSDYQTKALEHLHHSVEVSPNENSLFLINTMTRAVNEEKESKYISSSMFDSDVIEEDGFKIALEKLNDQNIKRCKL